MEEDCLERPRKRICLDIDILPLSQEISCNESEIAITLVCANMPCFGEKYILSENELKDCIRIGKERNSKNVASKTKNLNYSQRDDNEIHIQGVIGEYVFCKLFHIDSSLLLKDTSCRNAFNEKTFDCVFGDEKTVDVKTTIYSSADIRVSQQKRFNSPNFYSLVIIENMEKFETFESLLLRNIFPRVSFRGMIASENLLQPENLKQCGNDNRWFYCVSQKTLEKSLKNFVLAQ